MILDITEANFQNVQHLMKEGLEKIKPGHTLIVDLKNLQHCDSSIICLLIYFLRNSQKQAGDLRIKSPSLQLQKLFHLYGLTDFFVLENDNI